MTRAAAGGQVNASDMVVARLISFGVPVGIEDAQETPETTPRVDWRYVAGPPVTASTEP